MEGKLGEGGFGEAWLARHVKTGEHRVFKFCFDAVALRTLQHETTLFRLLKETLGQRDDIARILDWDFDSSPYFIESEYTEGGNLFDWAEAQGGLGQVPLETRLDLVAQIAEALGAAHSVGVLHKDIKPRNVLVADANGRPRARLTDFGIGRILDRGMLEEAGITQLEGSVELTDLSSASGTLMYMAPERVEGREATVEADIYAVGIMLYQMVVGDFRRTLAQGWERKVEDELLRQDIADAVDGSSSRRIGDARQLAERLRALESRRREREIGLARVAAAERASASLAVSRRRRQVLVVALVSLSLFTLVVAYQARRANQEARRANQEAQRANQEAQRATAEAETAERVSDFLVELFQVSDPSEARGNTVTAREILDRGAEKIDSELADEPLMRARLSHTIGGVYYNLGLYTDAEPIVEKALELRREQFGPDSVEVADTATTLAHLYWYQDRFDEAEPLYKLALANREAHLGADDPSVASSLNNLGLHYVVVGKYDLAEPLYESSLEIRQQAFGDDHPRTATALHNLAELYTLRGRDEDGLALLQRSAAISLRSLGPDSPSHILTEVNVADLLRKLGRLDEADALISKGLPMAQRVVGVDHFVTLAAMVTQAALWREQGKLEESEAMFAQVLMAQERKHGAKHAYLATTLREYAELLVKRQRSREAAPLLLRALEIQRQTTGDDHPLTRRAETAYKDLQASIAAAD